MSEEQVVKREVVHKDARTKTIYHYVDTENNYNIRSKEIFKKEDKEVYYPFYINRNKQIRQKYKKIKSLTFKGFKNAIPAGFIKSYERGYGVTRQLKPLIRFAETNLAVRNITISKKEKTRLWKSSLIINHMDLERIRKNVSAELRSCNENTKASTNNYFAVLLPDEFEPIRKKYQKGIISKILQEYDNVIGNLSVDDKSSLLSFFERLSLHKKEIFERRTLLKTKEKIDKIYIEDVLNKFKRLLNLKMVTEARWQEFFRENGWIFSQLFAYPTVLLRDKVYVGGTTIENPGKIIDFLYTNKLTHNVALIEIKTHKTKLLAKKPYRGTDVFSIDRGLSGAINQILDQRDNLYREANSRFKDTQYDIFNPKCLLVAGLISTLDKKQRKCFELFRHSSKDVEIITFDELSDKIKSILNIFRQDENEDKSEN
jgi:hypothetical protein